MGNWNGILKINPGIIEELRIKLWRLIDSNEYIENFSIGTRNSKFAVF